MAIESRPFGPTVVSGEAAKLFARKIACAHPAKAAVDSLKEGRKMAAIFEKQGYVSISLGVKPANVKSNVP